MIAHPAPGEPPLGPPPLVDPEEIRRAFQVLTTPEQVTELRILNAKTEDSPRYAYQASGYFNNVESLLKALRRLRSAKGVYITLHPCNPMLLARANNRLRTPEEMRLADATSDQHITRLRWLLIDVDPDRPAGISSTEEEHEAALLQARLVKGKLHDLGWPDPLEADSGNGAHLLYAIDLPAEEGVKETGLMYRTLKGLAARFDTASQHEPATSLRILIDQTVFNPSRICKLYGTLACKGDHTTERPHRMARLLVVPPHFEPVPRDLLGAIAVPVPLRAPARLFRIGARTASFDLARWIEEHRLEVGGPTPWQGGQRWVFRICPWNAEHTDHSAYLVQQANGAIAAGCHHNSCQGKGWKDLRALYEPERNRERYAEMAERSETVIPFPTRDDDVLTEQTLPEMDLDFVLDCLKRAEEGDARLYARLFGGRCIYDHTDGIWYEWQGHFWKRDDRKHALLLASGPLAAVYLEASASLSDQAAEEERSIGPHLQDQETQRASERYTRLKEITTALIERARRLRTLKRAQSVLTYAQALLPITADAWDTNPWLLGTSDGVLDLCSGTLRPGKPDDYIRTIIPTSWQGLDTPAPRFEQFLREIFADRTDREREELIMFLQRALGYGVSGLVTEHVFLMLYGEEGRNGKDTLMSLLHSVLGAIVGPVSNDVILANNKLSMPGSAKPHLCSLQGKRIAWANETDRGARFDIGQVKFLTGGGAISARQLYGRDYAFDPSHLLVLLTNHKPHADASDAAFWERLCPIVFTIRFVEHPSQPNERRRDPMLSHALEAEASGILAWLVRGCLQWQQYGLAVPASVLLGRRTYREEEDTLGEFLQECCIFGEQRSIGAGKLYEHYKTWAINNSLKHMNGRAFGQEMRKRVAWFHKRTGGVYQGLDILADDEEEEEDVTDQNPPLYPSQSASQAYLPPGAMVSGDRSDRTFQKTPLMNQQNCQTRSFSNHPSLLSPPPKNKGEQVPFLQPGKGFEASLPEEGLPPSDLSHDRAYEEFDL